MREWLKRIFYIPKHEKPSDENILRLLMPSVVGIALCMVCLAGSTWAWFSASVQTVAQTIEAANFDIAVTVNGELVFSPVTLEAGQQYTVTLTATGNAPSGGYCEVKGGAVPLYTETILPDRSLTFTLIPEKDAVYTFTAVWGKYSSEADITDGYTIERAQPDTDAETSSLPTDAHNAAGYVVQSGDTLGKIAQEYGTTVEKLAAYNGIENPNEIQIGQTFKIPPEDYEIPSPESTEPTGSEPPEPDLSETDETNESQSTQAPAG